MANEAAVAAGAAGAGAPAANGTGASQPPAGAAPAGSSASTGAAQAGQTAGQPQAGSAAPGEFEYVVDGKSYKLSNRDEIVALLQKGHDYTRKTQSLSETQRRNEQQLQARVQAEVQRHLAQMRGNQNGEGQEPDPIAEVTKRQQAMEERMADERLERTLHDLKSKFPLLHTDLFLLEAQKRGIEKFEDLEALADEQNKARDAERGSIFEEVVKDSKHPLSAKWRQAIIDEYVAAKLKEGQPKSETGSAGSPAGAGAPQAPKSRDEADARALARLTAMGAQ